MVYAVYQAAVALIARAYGSARRWWPTRAAWPPPFPHPDAMFDDAIDGYRPRPGSTPGSDVALAVDVASTPFLP